MGSVLLPKSPVLVKERREKGRPQGAPTECQSPFSNSRIQMLQNDLSTRETNINSQIEVSRVYESIVINQQCLSSQNQHYVYKLA
ncbi:hypothetical protein MRB53_005699 [Persea americana]|uniref:Uncharacterized protein n=1 Tax=Persea americana TaxID=3435 RepID=A0ACC2ME86_PERAE|nr:hypothetical protein MRB53_005699 [Persea americana]